MPVAILLEINNKIVPANEATDSMHCEVLAASPKAN